MKKLKLFAITSLILVSFTAFAGQGDDRKNENSTERRVTTLEEKVESLEASDGITQSRLSVLETSDADLQGRVSALEASDADNKSRLDTLERMGEFLLTWAPSDGSPDCGIVWENDADWDDDDVFYNRTFYGGGKDTYPPSFTGEYSGDLTHIAYNRRILDPPADPPICFADELPIASSPTDIVAISMEGNESCSFLQKAQNAADRGYGAAIIFSGFQELPASVRMTAPDGVSPFPIPTIFIRGTLHADSPYQGRVVFKGPAQFCSERPNFEWRAWWGGPSVVN